MVLCSRWSKLKCMQKDNHKINKGGRPEKGVKRKKRVTIRLTAAEHFILSQKAEKVKIPLASYIRKCGLHTHIRERLSREDRHFFRQLTGLSNNINQMAKLAHQEGLLSAFAHFKNELNLLDKLLKKFQK